MNTLEIVSEARRDDERAREENERIELWMRLSDDLFAELDQLGDPESEEECKRVSIEDAGFNYDIVFFKSGNYLGIMLSSEYTNTSLVYKVDRKGRNVFVSNSGNTDEKSLSKERFPIATMDQLEKFKGLIALYEEKSKV